MPSEKKQYSVRLPADVSTAVETYADNHDISNADALRRACRQFFVEEHVRPDGGEVIDRLDRIENQQTTNRGLLAGMLAGIAYIAISATTAINGLWWAGVGILIIAAIAVNYWRTRP